MQCVNEYTYINTHKILDDCQNSFRKNRSTSLAVYKFIQEAINITNNEKDANGLLLDMTKA